MTFALSLTQAPEHSFHNGALGADARQYSIRPTQRVHNGPRIEAAIAGMAAGEYRSIWVESADGLFYVHNEANGQSYPCLDWTPRGVWHAPSSQIIMGGRRGSFKFYAYSDASGDWRVIAADKDLGRSTVGTVHYYGSIADDGAGGIYLGGTANDKIYHYDATTEQYTKIASHAAITGDAGSMLAWSTDADGGAGALFKILGSTQSFLKYTVGTDSWTTLATNVGNNPHALLGYNPVAQRFMLVGGTSTTQRATLIDNAGAATQVTDVPLGIAMNSGSWITAHPSGCWLVRCGIDQTETPHLFAAWPNAANDDVIWQDLGVAPDAALSNATVLPDPARGMVMILGMSGLYAYKLPVVSDPYAIPTLSNLSSSNLTATGARLSVDLSF